MDYSQYKQIEFRRKFWKFFGASIYLDDPVSQQSLGFIKMKAWKLREDVRLFRDETLQQEIIRISARQIIDFGATYDVFDSPTNQQLFSMRRKGLKSMFVRDHWDLSDVNGNIFGSVQETSSALALARRWLELLPFGDVIGLIFAFVPQTYKISTNDAAGTPKIVGNVTHRKNPIVVKMLLDTTSVEAAVDPRVNVAIVSMLSIVDATKNS